MRQQPRRYRPSGCRALSIPRRVLLRRRRWGIISSTNSCLTTLPRVIFGPAARTSAASTVITRMEAVM